jgi:ABC-type Fe3+-hydroxamate transport system substrate-binding protein
VFVQWGKQDLPARLLELGKTNGWIVENFDILSIDEIDRAQQRLAQLLTPTTPLTPKQLTSARIQQVRDAHPSLSTRGTVLLIASAGSTFGILGPASCHAQVLERLGIQPAIPTGGAWLNMDAEDVRALNPSGIILIQPRAWGSADVTRTPEHISSVIQEQLGALIRINVPAVKDGRVGVIDDPLSLIPSTSMAVFAEDVAKIVNAWPESEQK